MANGKDRDARIFSVETRFERMARRPGGIQRDRAIERAQAQIEEIKVGFDEWLDGELQKLRDVVAQARAGTARPDWIDFARAISRQAGDVGTTMDFALLTFIANALYDMLDSVAAGADCDMTSIDCYVDALFLARQKRYRHLKPEQVPELTSGLRRVVERQSAVPQDGSQGDRRARRPRPPRRTEKSGTTPLV